MTTDEELKQLEEDIRRAKIEFEAYFSGGQPRPPADTIFRVERALKTYSEAGNLSATQRFRANQLAQRYSVYNELWRKRLRDKEEGREFFARPQNAAVSEPAEPVRVAWSDPDREREKVDALMQALLEAKRAVGDRTDDVSPVRFQHFVREKTRELKQKLGCERVQFTVSVVEGRVKFTAVKDRQL